MFIAPPLYLCIGHRNIFFCMTRSDRCWRFQPRTDRFDVTIYHVNMTKREQLFIGYLLLPKYSDLWDWVKSTFKIIMFISCTNIKSYNACVCMWVNYWQDHDVLLQQSHIRMFFNSCWKIWFWFKLKLCEHQAYWCPKNF